MKNFLKENWFKFGILLAVFFATSVFTIFVIQKQISNNTVEQSLVNLEEVPKNSPDELKQVQVSTPQRILIDNSLASEINSLQIDIEKEIIKTKDMLALNEEYLAKPNLSSSMRFGLEQVNIAYKEMLGAYFPHSKEALKTLLKNATNTTTIDEQQKARVDFEKFKANYLKGKKERDDIVYQWFLSF